MPYPAAAAQGATLLFSPSSGSFFTGGTFNVSLVLDTGPSPVNAFEVNVRFPPDKLQVSNPSVGTSFVSIWVTQPSYSNTEGTMTFRGGVPSPGITTTNGIITTITFRARGTGEAEISYDVSSQVLANDGKGTNILVSRGVARFILALPAPEGPEVISPTHPDPNVWYQNPSPTFFWKKDPGVEGFSYEIDQDPFGVPDNASEGDNTSASFTNLEDGTWYFHLKAYSGGTWGGVTHFIFRIDRTAPAEFGVDRTPTGIVAPEVQPVVTFITTDGASGVDHYEVKVIKTSGSNAPQEVSFFTEETSPYPVPVREKGSYQVVIRAFDRAGNTRDAVHKIEVRPPEPGSIQERGVLVFGVLVRWLYIFLFLGLLLLLLLALSIAVRYRHRMHGEVLRGNLARVEAKFLEDYQRSYEALRAARDAAALPGQVRVVLPATGEVREAQAFAPEQALERSGPPTDDVPPPP